MKVCPSCRKSNPDDALVCDGCSADLSEVPVIPTGKRITMFGAAPDPIALEPLERAIETVAQQYGAAAQAAQNDAAQEEAAEKLVFEKVSSGESARPRKPWE